MMYLQWQNFPCYMLEIIFYFWYGAGTGSGLYTTLSRILLVLYSMETEVWDPSSQIHSPWLRRSSQLRRRVVVPARQATLAAGTVRQPYAGVNFFHQLGTTTLARLYSRGSTHLLTVLQLLSSMGSPTPCLKRHHLDTQCNKVLGQK